MALVSRCAAAAAAGAIAAVLSACGSGSTSSTSTPTSTRTATTTTTMATSTTTVTTSATGARLPRAAGAVPGCASGRTGVTVARGVAGLGHGGFVLLFRNAGAQSCHLTGYPGVALVPAAAGRHELDVARTPNGYLGGLAPTDKANPVVVLRPGQTASALLEGLNASQPGGGPCPRYGAVRVTPPNQTATARLAMKLAICNPQIHPVVPGTTGRQG